MNRIKVYINGLGRGSRLVLLSLAVIFVGAGIAQAAATTIGTSVTTTGSISTTGSGTMSIAGLATFLGGATTTQFTLLSGDTIKNTTASTTVISGTISVSTTTTVGLNVSGASTLASTTATAFKVGQVGTQLSRIVSGYCVIASVTVAANTAIQTGSSTAAYAECAPPTGSMPLITGDRVFVEATSSLPSYIVLQAASSTPTANGNISVELFNLSTSTAVSSATYSLNYWAFQ